MLTELVNKIKAFLKENQRDLYLAALVFLMSVASFGLGRLSAIWPERESIKIENVEGRESNVDAPAQNAVPPSTFNTLQSREGAFVASKNGSSYHLPECPGAKQIKDENRIWFKTADAARAAGYKPAGNCPGL